MGLNMPQNFVPGCGPLDCRIALVAEAPSFEEVRLMKPLIGPTGQMNDDLLTSAGIFRHECYITNVWKQPLTKDRKTGKGWETKLLASEQGQQMLEILTAELNSCNANIIIAMGSLASQALTGYRDVVRRRGSLYYAMDLAGQRKVMVARHPSAALPLRLYPLQRVIVNDYMKAKRESKFPELRLPKKQLIIDPNVDDVIRYILDCERFGSMSFDIEIINEEVSHLGLSSEFRDASFVEDHAMCIAFNDFSLGDEANIWTGVTFNLENPGILKLGQNLSFDATFLFRRYGIRVTNMEDTMIAQGIANAGFPTIMRVKGLDFITSIYTNNNYYKDEGKRHFKGIDNEIQFREYNAMDAAVCVEALPEIKKELKMLKNEALYKRTCRLIEPLVYMAEHGTRVDRAAMTAASDHADQKITELRIKLREIIGYDINPSSPKQLAQYFYVEKGVKPYISRSGVSKGNVTTDVTALKRLSRRGFTEARVLLDIRHYAKRKNTYYDVKLSEDERLKCSYNPVGTKQGRPSSGKNIFGEGQNNQNLPEEMLGFLLADKGHVAYSIDLEQAENRIVAYIAPDPEMINAFESGIDIHRKTAGWIFDKPYDQVTDKRGTCPICADPKICGHKGERFWGKKADHGFDYGLGASEFALINEISDKDGQRIRRGFFDLYSGVPNYWRWTERKIMQDRMITNLIDRTFYYVELINQDKIKQIYSFIPQSTVADVINWRGVLFVWDNYDDVELLNTIYDSITFQIPLHKGWDYHARVLKEICSSLETPLSWRSNEFIIPVNVEIGINLRDMETVNMKSLDLKNHIKNLYNSIKC